MKAFYCVQYSDIWWNTRRGVPTASQADRIVTPKTRKPSAQQSKYIAQLVAETVDLRPNWFTDRVANPAQRHGLDTEPEARRWYAQHVGRPVQMVGFCCTDDGRLGASPDGLVGTDGLLELKCVQLETQAEYLMEPDLLLDAYRCQCHAQLIVTGREWVDLVSYTRELDPLVIRVTADDFTDLLRREFNAFNDRYDAALKRLGIRRLYPTAEEPDPEPAALDPADDGIGEPDPSLFGRTTDTSAIQR